MNHRYKLGVEIHIQLNTKNKLFTYSSNAHTNDPNINVSYFDIGVPGTFPHINVEAINKAIVVAKLFSCKLSDKLVFDRKHYYYMDLPCGYQITQYEHPVGTDGFYRISNNVIKIKDVHIECDAGKLKEYGDKICVDYNRCGAPLVEVVTDTSFRDVSELEEMIILVINDVRMNNLSDARLERGNLRVDVNISRIINENTTTCRFEIKNLNSVKSIKKAVALAKEILISKTEHDQDMTMSYDESKCILIGSRKKEGREGYMYMYEPSLYPVSLSLFDSSTEPSFTIQKVESLCLKFPEIDRSLLVDIICDENLNLMLELVLSDSLLMSRMKTVLSFITENKTLFDEYADDVVFIRSIIIQGAIILVKGKATKVNINTTIRSILESTKFEDLEQVLIQNKMIIEDVEIKIEIVASLVQEKLGDITKLKEVDEKSINFLVGHIMKNIQKANPTKVKEVLLELRNKL